MANQAIALQARAPQSAGLGPAIAQGAQMINMMAQQRAAERQAAQAQQAMDINAAQEARAAAKAVPEMKEAEAKAGAAQVKYVMDFMDASELAIANVRDPQQARAVGSRLKQMFPEPEFQQSIDETLGSLPQDPAQFEAWREQALFLTMDAKDQLAREFQRQTTGREERIISMPKYGRGGAVEVPGSRIEAAEDMQYVKNDRGDIFAMPKTKPGTGGFDGGSAPAVGGRGPVAKALQTNPGALKDGPFTRSQPGYTGNSGGFATFSTPQAGIAAQEKLLQSAYVGRGFNTIDKIINRYAPQGPENSAASVSNYKRYISQQTGIDINTPIGAGQIPAVAQAMREFETGNTKGRGTAGGGGGGPTPVIRGSDTKANEAFTAMEAASARYDETIAVAKRLLANPDLDMILGNIQGNIPETALSVVSQGAANALADYNTLLTTAGFQELQAMRDASPTGGALGQVAVEENKMLQKSAFSSSRAQSEAKFKQAVRDYISRLERSRSRVVGAYDRQFGERFMPSNAPRATPKAAPKGKTPTGGWGKATVIGD
jgi:hypothetical protein